jgi:signal transduction histidine kinase
MEAFLAAVPADYCGFAPDGALAYSAGFATAFGLAGITGLGDLQNALAPGDAAALETVFARLHNDGTPFTLTVANQAGTKTLRLSGRRGADAENTAHFNIIWLDDITPQAQQNAQQNAARAAAESDRDRLQGALDALPLPLWMRDTRTGLMWCNRAYARLLDTSAATVIAEQRELPFKPAKKGAAKTPGKTLAQAALDNASAESTTAHIIAGGQRRLMTVTESPLPGGLGTLGSAQDITREEELETEQKRYTAAHKELLEQLGTAIGIFDAQQKLEFYNSAFGQLWSLEDQYLNTAPKLGDLMEKLRENRRLPEQADFRKFKQSWLGMFTGLITPHEDMLYLPSGRALRMLTVPHPMGGLMMTFEDVTSRLELESSYNTLIAVQKETLDNLTEGVAVYGGDGRLKLWNPAFARLWGLHPEDLQDQPHINRIVEKMKGRFEPETWEQNRSALTGHGLERRAREGRLECAHNLLVAYSTVPLPDGGVLVTHADVTDTARVENALREKNAALQTAERLKLDFLANVSYQLRTPLNAIMGFTEILSNEYFGPLNARQKEYTSGMYDAGEKLVSLINNILDLSSIEAGYMELETAPVDIAAMLHGIIELTREWARKEKIEVALEIMGDAGTVTADERRLKQVLVNLIRNAIAFTPAGGKITLAAARTKQNIVLTVSDNGQGIPAEDRARIFEPFERAQPGTVGGGRGAGIGLTLVKNIVEMHKGTVALDSIEGQGTTVTITLPLGE